MQAYGMVRRVVIVRSLWPWGWGAGASSQASHGIIAGFCNRLNRALRPRRLLLTELRWSHTVPYLDGCQPCICACKHGCSACCGDHSPVGGIYVCSSPDSRPANHPHSGRECLLKWIPTVLRCTIHVLRRTVSFGSRGSPQQGEWKRKVQRRLLCSVLQKDQHVLADREEALGPQAPPHRPTLVVDSN